MACDMAYMKEIHGKSPKYLEIPSTSGLSIRPPRWVARLAAKRRFDANTWKGMLGIVPVLTPFQLDVFLLVEKMLLSFATVVLISINQLIAGFFTTALGRNIYGMNLVIYTQFLSNLGMFLVLYICCSKPDCHFPLKRCVMHKPNHKAYHKANGTPVLILHAIHG